MNCKRIPCFARAVFGGALACMILLCSFAAFSPSLHEVMHADAKAADHFCHLALWGKGDLLAAAPPPALPPLLLHEILLPPSEAQSFFSIFDSLSFPTRGPPVLS
ncbi:MAG: hypothetical protein JWM16_6080 [Verrucomicrobiales bacterium]|nr:hypothetical protein [Verrucomicrobiales bacterium]